MALITQSLNSLINGVSQQPAILRLQSQAEAQLNALSSPVDGVRRRPPTTHIAKVTSGDFSNATFHLIDRDASEKYAAVLLDDDLRVFDLQSGAEKTVSFPDGKTYLNATSPKTAFKAVTVADYTFIVNREVETGMTADRSPTRPAEALLFFRAATYREKFTVTINGNSWGLEMPQSASGGNTDGFLSTDNIAGAFETLMVTGSGTSFASTPGAINYYPTAVGPTLASLGFSLQREGSVIRIYRSDAADFTLKVAAGGGGDHLIGIKGTVQRFSDLPRDGVDGFLVQVQGDPDSDAGSYYVRYAKTQNAPVIDNPGTGGGTGSTDGGSGTYGGVTVDWRFQEF